METRGPSEAAVDEGQWPRRSAAAKQRRSRHMRCFTGIKSLNGFRSRVTTSCWPACLNGCSGAEASRGQHVTRRWRRGPARTLCCLRSPVVKPIHHLSINNQSVISAIILIIMGCRTVKSVSMPEINKQDGSQNLFWTALETEDDPNYSLKHWVTKVSVPEVSDIELKYSHFSK